MNNDSARQKAASEHAVCLNHLLGLNVKMSGLVRACEGSYRRISPLDTMPRHDSLLDAGFMDETFSSAVDFSEALVAALASLKTSQHQISLALERICGCYTGSQKQRSEERLRRHRSEAEKLVSLFEQLRADYESPNRPFLVRKQILSSLLPKFTVVIDLLHSMRVELKALGAGEDIGDFEDEARKLRAQVARWRDNPSQKIGHNMHEWLERVRKLDADLAFKEAVCVMECLESGVKFDSRTGPWGSFARLTSQQRDILATQYPLQMTRDGECV